MKTKVFVLILVFSLVVTFAFAGGKQEGTTPAAASGEPQYGGTLTLWGKWMKDEPPSADIGTGANCHNWQLPSLDMPLSGDFVNYGPRGTGEWDFHLSGYIPREFLTAGLVESWEVDFDKAVWNIRKGIYWRDNGRGVMEDRELVAEDVAADIRYFMKAPAGKKLNDIIGKVYATSRYSLTIEFVKFDLIWDYLLGYEGRAVITPPEIEGSEDWNDLVGTGAWIFEEYVVGSHMSWVKNPDYWKSPATIDGKEYEIPFADRLIRPIIADEATRIAALETGKIDYFMAMPPPYWDHLDKISGLESEKIPQASSWVVDLQLLPGSPFSDLDIRRAVHMGTDMPAFHALMTDEPQIEHHIPLWPGHTTDLYTPYKDLPADLQELFDYNPEKAAKLVADKYPGGLTIEMQVDASDANAMDRAALIQSQWSKIGITVEVKPLDAAAYHETRYGKSFPHALMGFMGTGNPLDALLNTSETDGFFNYSHYSDETFDAMAAKFKVELDEVKRFALMKEAAVHRLAAAYTVPLNQNLEGHYWWSWLKNFYGEVYCSDNGHIEPMAYVWIDQTLKKELGY